MNKPQEFQLDKRTFANVKEEIATLSHAYTPEWRFDPTNPDVGSTLALLFAHQMSDNLTRLNQVLGKYHTEFVNMLGVSLLPAYPSSGVVTVDLIRDTVAGLPLPRGTKLSALADDDFGGETMIFETLSDVYITSAHLTDILSISGRFGKIIPLYGGPSATPLLPSAPIVEEDVIDFFTVDEVEVDEEPAPLNATLSLFDFEGVGVERNAVLMYHTHIFNTANDVDLVVRPIEALTGCSLAEELADGKQYRWSYCTQGGLVPFASVTHRGDCVLLRRGEDEELGKVRLDGVPYGVVCLERVDSTVHTVELSDLRVASSCDSGLPTFLCHNDSDLPMDSFLPFGESASVFDECYIGHDQMFSQQGALVTMSFDLSFQEKLVTFTPQQEKDNLKVIKRKPQTVLFETVRTTVDEVSLEYYNGLGWRRLPTTADWHTLFNGEHPGEISLSFHCPDDWQAMVVGGYEGRCVRLRVARADNCYLQPCLHNMPVMSNLALAYRYEGEWKRPQRLQVIRGTQREDFSKPLSEGRNITLFQPLPYASNGCYLGFDRKMEGSPVSILFDVTENVHFDNAPLRFEYSTLSGWKPLKVIDNTANLSSEGTVLFMPPSDFAPRNIEGISRFWLRLVDAEGVYDDPDHYHPQVRSILLNAVEIQNVETMEEEVFYVESSTPHMKFSLSAENILSAQVFVSEHSRLSQAMMQEMLRTTPERVQVEYDFLGQISGFAVLWDEVEHFDNSQPSDRHYVIDRMNNTICFGDGVNVMLPPATGGASFTVRVKCCKGERANLPPNSITELYGQALFIDTVTNPIATFAGSNMESIPSAHRRGASIVSGRGRLVSELDWVREVQSFSGVIEKVKCLAGEDLEGNHSPGMITVALMTGDYTDGAYTFNGLKDRLRSRLMERCEATVAPNQLILSEPVYVELSVDVWVQSNNAHHAFDLQNLIQESLYGFIDPLPREGHMGWDIGHLPTEAQIKMMLQSLRLDGHINRFIITARYVDKHGTHETSLANMLHNPFYIAVNGNHRIHIELPA